MRYYRLPVHDPVRKIAVVLALAVSWSLWATAARSSPRVAEQDPVSDCGFLRVEFGASGAPSSEGQPARAPAPPKKGDLELHRPLTETELRDLVRDLEPVKLKDGKGWAPKALTGVSEGHGIDPFRIQAVLSEAVTLLADLQSGEVLDRLRRAPGRDREDLVWLEQSYAALRGCVESRYDGFGGEASFAESARAVKNLRPELEALVRKGLETKTLSFSGPRRR